MNFFKSFQRSSNYQPLSINENGSGLPQPATQSRNNNPFKKVWNKLNPFTENFVRLEDDDNYVTSEPGYFELSRWDRMVLFTLTFAGSVACYIICILLFPILSLRFKKFAILWSMGSIFFLISFGILQGFKAYMQHLFLSTRILFTIVFGVSIILTLVSSLSLKSTVLSMLFAIIQMLSAIWYTVSYFPLGKQTLGLAGSIARNQVDGWVSS